MADDQAKTFKKDVIERSIKRMDWLSDDQTAPALSAIGVTADKYERRP